MTYLSVPRTICLFFLMSLANMAFAENKYIGHVDLIGQVGNDRDSTQGSLFVPLFQRDTNLLFLDLRGLSYFGTSDSESYEANAGLGYRQQILDRRWVAGGYVYFDHSSSRDDNLFNQITLGAEMMNETWKNHVNVYLPLTGHKTSNKNNSALLTGNNVFFSQGIETPMYGFDAEIGRYIKAVPGLSTYLAGYYFTANNVEDVTGGRFRAEYSLNDAIYRKDEKKRNWLLQNITLLGEVQYDHVRHTDGFIGLQLRIPFGKIDYSRLSKVDQRMTERVIRDIDIVTNTGNLAPNIVRDRNGRPLIIYYVNNQASDGGDGTYRYPFNQLKSAETASTAHDMIYVYSGDGTAKNQDEGIKLKEGQTLFGQGTDFSLKCLTLIPKGLYPVINNSRFSTIQSYGVELANNTRVTGLKIDGSSAANIYGADVKDIDISRNIIQNSQFDDGIQLIGDLDKIKIRHNEISNNAVSGIRLSGLVSSSAMTSNQHFSLQKNIINNNQRYGISVEGSAFSDQSLSQYAWIKKNTLIGNKLAGMNLFQFADGMNSKVSQKIKVAYNTVSDSSGDGIRVTSQAQNSNAYAFQDINLYKNTVTNNMGSGIYVINGTNFSNAAYAVQKLKLSYNMLDKNAAFGMRYSNYAVGLSEQSILATNNKIKNSYFEGVYVDNGAYWSNSYAKQNLIFSNNTLDLNGYGSGGHSGLRFLNATENAATGSTALQSASISMNHITNSFADGVLIENYARNNSSITNGSFDISNNYITGNIGNGLRAVNNPDNTVNAHSFLNIGLKYNTLMNNGLTGVELTNGSESNFVADVQYNNFNDNNFLGFLAANQGVASTLSLILKNNFSNSTPGYALINFGGGFNLNAQDNTGSITGP